MVISLLLQHAVYQSAVFYIVGQNRIIFAIKITLSTYCQQIPEVEP